MKKKISFLMALAMSFAMGVSATACEKWFNEEPPVVEEPDNGEENEGGNEGENEGENEGGNENQGITSKLSVAVATAEELAAFNATNITDYVNGTPVVLETAYTFTALETAEEAKASEYANWWADYYVSVDTAVDEGKLGLAGSYDAWQNGVWVAFYAPAVEANQEVGLLKTASGGEENKYWTYAEIVEFVGTFRCGAFDFENACAGVTLKVELRLTNPENAEDVVSVNVTTYTFA